MGFTPQDVKKMSIWEFLFATDGWKKANGAGESDAVEAPSEDEFYAMVATLDNSQTI